MPTYKNETNYTIYDGATPIPPGNTYETIRIVENTDLTFVSEDPYYPLANNEHSISFGAAETQSVDVDLYSGVLRVTSDVEVTIKPNSDSNPYGYTILAGEERDIFNDRNITSLYLTSTGSGSATVTELKDDYTVSKKV